MTDEIADYDDELADLAVEIAKGISQIEGISDPDTKATGIKNLSKRVDRMKEVLDGFLIEMRELAPSEAGPYRQKEQAHQAKLADFRARLDTLRAAPRPAAAAARPAAAADVERETDDLLSRGAAKQGETLGALDRINARIGTTEAVGEAINRQLAEDREKLEGMRSDFGEIDDGLKQSKKQLAQFWRRMQRDKCIRALLIVALLGILGVMIWSLVDPNFGVGGSVPAGNDQVNR